MSNPQPLDPIAAELDKATRDYHAGNLAAAGAAAQRLLEQHPDNHAVLCLSAALAAAERRYADAEQLYVRSQAAARSPREQAMSWSGLSYLGRSVGNLDAAEESSRRAMLADPGAVEYAMEFADVLAARGKFDSAVEVARGSMTRFPRDPIPCITLGNLLLRHGRHRDALAFYDMALQRNPNSAHAHFNASTALTMLGKLDGARMACENALKLDPGMAAYYQLSHLNALHADDPRIPALEARAEDESAPLDARIDAGFAVAMAFDKAGDADRAFPPLQRANALKRATFSYDIRQDEERIEKIVALFTPDFFRRFAGASNSGLAPIFVLGMPRSGTTLLEQMLAGHSQVRGGGELPYMIDVAREIGIAWGARGEAAPGSDEQVADDLRRAAAEYERLTQKLQGKEPRFTDKMPGNFMFIGLIHLMFPQASILHCRRDPVDTCLSNYQRLFSSDVPYSYDLTELGRYFRLYQRLMQHWHEVLPPGRILDVDYEAVVTEPEKELRRVLGFCGLAFEPQCLEVQDVDRSVTTASAVQVRGPIHGNSVHRWQKYRAHLDPLLEALGMEKGSA